MGTIANMNVALSLDDRGFSSGIQRVQQQAESFSKRLGSLGQTMSLAVTAPLVGIAGVAVKSAADFEQTMNVMAQVTGATGDQMAAMQQQAIDLGASTVFSAGEAADAMLELGKAGLVPEQIMGAIGGTMDLAAAGNLDLAQAATIASNAMNAFQLPASEVTDIANMLAAAANASSADVTDLAAGMQMAGAVFASNGQSIQDLNAGLAILANNGIAGSDAGTSLKTMLMRLAAPTGEAADVMADLGIQVFNADGSMRGFADIVGSLESATGGLSDQQRTMALNTIFGADAIRAASILAESGADGFADMQKAVTKEGSAAATAGARMKGFAGAMEGLKGAIDSFLITAALPFLDSLSGIVDMLAGFISGVSNLPAPVRNVAIGVGAVLAAAGPLLLIVSKLAPAFGMLGTVLGAVVSPVGLLVAAVGALVAVFATDFMGVRTALTGMVNNLLEMAGIDLGGIVDGFKAFGNYIGAVLEDGDSLNDWLTHLPPAIQPVAQAFGDLVATITGDASIGEKIQAIQADLGALWTSITELDWGGAWAAFQTWLDDWAQAVADSVQTIDWGGIAATGGEMFGTLRDFVVDAIQSIKWDKAFQDAGNLFQVIGNWVIYLIKKVPWTDLFGKAGDLFWQLKDSVVATIRGIPWDTLLGAAADLFAKLTGAIVAGWNAIPWDTLLGAAGDLFNKLTGAISTAWNAIPWGTLLGAASDLFSGLTDLIKAGWAAIPWQTIITSDIAMSDKIEQAIKDELGKISWAESVSKLDADFAAQADKMVVNWAAEIEKMDFTESITTWIDGMKANIEGADWAGMGTALADSLNNLFNPETFKEDSATAFAKLEQAVVSGIESINWTSVKEKLGKLDKAFADGLGEFAGAFSGTFVKPQWLTDLMAWSWPQLPDTPIEWLNLLLSWVWPTLPDPPVAWLLTLLDWLWPELPGNPVQWLTTLLDWDWPKFPAMPDWIGRLLGWAWPTAPGTPTGQTTSPTTVPTTNGVDRPLPNNGGYPVDINPPLPDGMMGGSAMMGAGAMGGAPLIGPVYVQSEVDLQALAYQVAQLLNRRR